MSLYVSVSGHVVWTISIKRSCSYWARDLLILAHIISIDVVQYMNDRYMSYVSLTLVCTLNELYVICIHSVHTK